MTFSRESSAAGVSPDYDREVVSVLSERKSAFLALKFPERIGSRRIRNPSILDENDGSGRESLGALGELLERIAD